MNIQAFEIPDATLELANWLEQRLVSMHLRELVTDLSAVHGSISGTTRLEDLLGDQRGSVLADGLRALTREQLQTLCMEPRLLLELQEVVLASGGPYWLQNVSDNDAITTFVEQRRPQLLSGSDNVKKIMGVEPRSAWYLRPIFVSMVTAAAVLVACTLYVHYLRPAPAQAVFGWNRQGLFAEGLSREAYFITLADAANEWFDVQPREPAELAARIGQFRDGCSRLILAEHQPLPKADQIWLREKCRAWGEKIDGLRIQLESGESPEVVRSAMDETVRKLTVAIKERSRDTSG